MELALGVGLLSATAVTFAWAFGAHRRPTPARWTANSGLSSLFCVAAAMLFATSLAYLLAALFNPLSTIAGLGPLTLAVIVGAPVVAWFAVPRLIAPARGSVSAIIVAPLTPPANTPGKPPGSGKIAA